MRHAQLSNKTNTLTKFKKKIDKILQQINTLNQADKKKAFNYVHMHFKGQNYTPSQNQESNILTLGAKRKSKHVVRSEGEEVTKKQKPRATFACPVCNENKNTKISLLKHLEMLHLGTPLSCFTCRRTFNSESSYSWHKSHLCRRKKRLLVKHFKCFQCSKEFALRRHLILHQAGHKKNNCGYCNTVLARRDDLVQHLLIKHNVKLKTTNFKCDYCKKVFIKRRSLYCHLKKHTEFACSECGNISKNLIEHIDHQNEHNNKKPWQCLHCKNRFSRRKLYFTHLQRHERYKCLTCKESYASKAQLHQHRKKGHTVQGLDPILHCPYCKLAFCRTIHLQKHLFKHTERESIMCCKNCDKTFTSLNEYFQHCLENSHDDITIETNSYICECCGQQYKKKYLLEQHLLIKHGKERGSYSCDYCDYTSRFKPNITRHMTLHFTEEKQFICDHCGKHFSSIAVLTDHISYIHKQVKQFKCLKCEKSFKRNAELTRHQSTHSDLRPYNCVFCTNTYKRISHLRRHEKNMHGIISKTNRVQRLEKDTNGSVLLDKQKSLSNTSKNLQQDVSLAFLDFDVADFISQNGLVNNSIVYCNQVLNSFKEETVQIIEYVNPLVPLNSLGIGLKPMVDGIPLTLKTSGL